jgi:hypothetical protein
MSYVMSFPQHRLGLCQMNVSEDFDSTVIPRPTRRLDGVITACWAKPRVWDKQGYVKEDSYGQPPPPPVA